MEITRPWPFLHWAAFLGRDHLDHSDDFVNTSRSSRIILCVHAGDEVCSTAADAEEMVLRQPSLVR
jgi:hypothetical protein